MSAVRKLNGCDEEGKPWAKAGDLVGTVGDVRILTLGGELVESDLDDRLACVGQRPRHRQFAFETGAFVTGRWLWPRTWPLGARSVPVSASAKSGIAARSSSIATRVSSRASA